jgi:elongation factor Ts
MSKKVSPKDVKKLREDTGAGMMDAKKALDESGGNLEKAVEILAKKGQLKAGKKADRATGAGLVEAYVHGGGRIGVMVEVNCETDFVARNEEFKTFVHDLALHVAAAAPEYVSRDDVPMERVNKEREIAGEQSGSSGKPKDIVEKIVKGRLEKFYAEICLLEQPFVKDDKLTIQELVNQKIATLGENIQVKKFVRFVLGE